MRLIVDVECLSSVGVPEIDLLGKDIPLVQPPHWSSSIANATLCLVLHK